MYVESLGSRRKSAQKKSNLRDLLRLTLAAVEVSATRREVLDEVAVIDRLPNALKHRRHAVYETSVVYEFSQLARSDFEAHGNTALWERPILNPATRRVQNIDMSLFRTARISSVVEDAATDDLETDVETRIEFGKFDGTLRPDPDYANIPTLQMNGGNKLASDAEKLYLLSGVHDAGTGKTDIVSPRLVENFIVLWKELDSRVDGPHARLTRALGQTAHSAADAYARAVTTRLQKTLSDPSFTVKAEASAACRLSTYRDKLHRSAYATIFSLPKTTSRSLSELYPPFLVDDHERSSSK